MRRKIRRTLKQQITANESAHEAYAVLMQGHRSHRSLPKDFLLYSLSEQVIYSDFLKLCAEYDSSNDLLELRKGLFLVVKAIGVNKIARATKINRVTLYRMLKKGGNPSVKNLVALLRALNMAAWVVEKEFLERREQVRRRSGRR